MLILRHVVALIGTDLPPSQPSADLLFFFFFFGTIAASEVELMNSHLLNPAPISFFFFFFHSSFFGIASAREVELVKS